jgi:uncharacterized protein involved in type VI secretion and phage assembly
MHLAGPATIVGAVATVTLKLGSAPARYISGIVSRFLHSGGDREFSSYSAELVPKLWMLTLHAATARSGRTRRPPTSSRPCSASTA